MEVQTHPPKPGPDFVGDESDTDSLPGTDAVKDDLWMNLQSTLPWTSALSIPREASRPTHGAANSFTGSFHSAAKA